MYRHLDQRRIESRVPIIDVFMPGREELRGIRRVLDAIASRRPSGHLTRVDGVGVEVASVITME